MTGVGLGSARRTVAFAGAVLVAAAVGTAPAADRHVGATATPRNGLIAFQAYGDTTKPSDGIYLVNADGSGLHRLARQLPNSAEPRWSPDGTKLLLLTVTKSAQSLYTIAPDGTSRHFLLSAKPPGRAPGYASWSPDGRMIAFARGRACGQIVCGADLYVLTLATRRIRKVAGNVSGTTPPAWAPDGRRIAYTGGQDGHLYLTTLKGRSIRIFVGQPGLIAYPSWTPTSQRLAFTIFAAQTRSFVIDADGRNLHRILHTDDAAVDWSPDGRSLVFARGTRSGDIYVAASDGSHVTRLTDNARDETLPDWQPLP